MIIGVVFNCLNAIAKERRPKVSSMHDFLSSGHFEEMTTTSVAMTGIEHLLKFSMDETMTMDNVDTAMINIITNEEKTQVGTQV